jgi:transcriptional regulator with XRE-family HTH domain
MRNERLREAIHASGMNITDLGAAVGVDAKTAQRWVYEGRVPRRQTADRVSHKLGVPMDWLWPGMSGGSTRHPNDFVRLYAHRAQVPHQLWLELIQGAETEIDMLAIAGLFLSEDNPQVIALLRRKAELGVRVRVTVADPASRALRRRGEEELLFEAVIARATMAHSYFEPLLHTAGVEFRVHSTTVYNSIFRFDDQMLVNQHIYGVHGYLAPLLHLRRESEAGLFDLLASSFQRVWQLARPIAAPQR